MASFIAAGTAYATHGVNMIPFFIYYSMFGFQRIGDLIWAAGDCAGRGFLLGATAGRTTLDGEGLQHQDGHSHAARQHRAESAWPTIPAFAYEIAVIIQDGMRRMYQEREDIFYYLTLYNENYPMPPMPQERGSGHPQGSLPLSGVAVAAGAPASAAPRLRRRSSARRCARSACSRSAMASRRTSGARPPTRSCGARRSNATA